MAAAARATGVHVAGPARAAGRQRTARARPRATLRAAADGGGDGAAASDEEERQRALEAADAAEDVTVEGNQVVKDSVRDLRALQASEREVLNKAADLLEQLGVKNMPRVPENIRDLEDDDEDDEP